MNELKYKDYTLSLQDLEKSTLSDKEYIAGNVTYDHADVNDGETPDIVSKMLEFREGNETKEQLTERLETLFHNWVDDGAVIPEMSPEDTIDNDDTPEINVAELRDALGQTEGGISDDQETNPV